VANLLPDRASAARTSTHMHAVHDDLPWPRAGLLLGRYEALGVIGRGGMGVVSRARDVQTGRLVAIKRVRGMDDRAQREAIASARLHHPAIVELIDARLTDDGWILVSELVEGADLRHVLRAGPVPELDVARFAGSTLRGLAHAHEHGVVHRDVKPANILCPRDPRRAGAWAKLTDFGVAALHGAETLTAVGDVVGTMSYMAPEQARGDRAGAPADVFALAVVVYEALTGVNPRRGHTPAETAVRALGPMPPLAHSRPDLPREVAAAVDACLEVEPHHRGDLWDLDDGLRHLAAVGRGGRPTSRRPAAAPTAIAPAPVDEHTRHRPDTPAPPIEPLPAPGRHPGEFALSPAGLGPQAAPAPVVDAWPEPYEGEQEPVRLAIPGRMPKVPLRVLGTAGAAAALGVLTSNTATPPVLVAIAAAAFVVPRLTWIAIAATTAAILAGGDPTSAALAALCIVAPLLLLPSRPPLWPAGGLAAGLVMIGGAGAWPALAALAPRPATRLGLGIHGALVAAVVATAVRTPILDAPPGDLATVATTFALPLAAIWGGGALLLGVIVRGRTLGADLAMAALWAGAIGGAMAGAHVADPRPELWIGPAVAACFVVAARAALREQDRARIAPID
jgi:eukaryotic-like serine/threonine-protein kinase